MAPVSFVWTDKESELLLNLVLEYKVNKTQEGVDWESCQSKYVDILTLFLEAYPAETSDEFPHAKGEGLTRTIMTTKMKAIRSKYRQAVDSGRRSGFGRVVLLYFELCEQIWGGSPATTALSSGVETTDLDDSLDVLCSSTSSSSTVEPPDALSDAEQENSLASTVKQRRDLLQAKLRGHRHERLKRKLPAETLWLNALEEDQQVKKKLLDFLETSERRAADNLTKITDTIQTLSTSIAEGFSMLRHVMQPPPGQTAHFMPYDPRGHIYPHTPVQPLHPHPAFHSFQHSSPSVSVTQNTNGSNNAQDTSRSSTPGCSYTRGLFTDD